LRLISNSTNGVHKITGFSKEKILDFKGKVSDYKSGKIDNEEFMDILKAEFPKEKLVYYEKYLEKVETFIKNFLMKKDKKIDTEKFLSYPYLKKYIKKELERYSQNLQNFKLNCQNSLRLLKSNQYLENCLSLSKKLYENYQNLMQSLEIFSYEERIKNYQDLSRIWIKVNEIKNPTLIVKKNELLEVWGEISNLYEEIKNQASRTTKRKLFGKPDSSIEVNFELITNLINKNLRSNKALYQDILHLLNDSQTIIETEHQEYLEPLKQKETKRKIDKIIEQIIKELSLDHLESFINTIKKLNNDYKIVTESKQFEKETIKDRDIAIIIPQISNAYLNLIEKKYQEIFNEDKRTTSKLNNLKKDYSNEINDFKDIIEELENLTSIYESIVHPFEDILQSIQNIFSNLVVEIENIF
jgi:hypothetical protein